MSGEVHIPYESLSRAEADEIIESSKSNILSRFGREELEVIKELLAHAYYRGLETAFGLSDSQEIVDPISSPIQAYSDGFNDGLKSVANDAGQIPKRSDDE